MKLFVHQIGNHRVRCQIEAPDDARTLWEQFISNVLTHVFATTGDLADAPMPVINGLGFMFKGKLLTAFGEGFDLVIVDADGLAQMAQRVDQVSPPKPPRRSLPIVND